MGNYDRLDSFFPHKEGLLSLGQSRMQLETNCTELEIANLSTTLAAMK
jgi:hypothetical protein